MVSGPRDPNIGQAQASPLTPSDNSIIGWLKSVYTALTSGNTATAAVFGTTADPDSAAGNVSSTATMNAKLGSLVTAAQDTTPVAVVESIADEYETVAASQTAQVLGATGAVGDRIARLIIQPTTTSPGNVILIDNATTIYTYPGGTVGADLKPIEINVGTRSVSGAWKVTTGTNVTVLAVGNFS